MITALCLNPSLDRTVYVERLERGGTNRVLREHTVPGGKGVNVARMMASFGLPSRAALFLGREDERLMGETLTGWGCGMRAVMLDGALRVNIKVMDQSRGEITELNAPGSPVNDRQLEAMEDLVIESAAQSRWLCLCGSLPPGCPDEYYARLIRGVRLRAPGCRIALDASGESFRLALREGPDLIKPNLDELSAFAGYPIGDIDEAPRSIEALMQGGAKDIILSMGARGARLYAGGTVLLVSGLKVPVATTVGAGDAMLSGYIAGLEEGLSRKEAFRLAAAAAAARVAGQEERREEYVRLIGVREE